MIAPTQQDRPDEWLPTRKSLLTRLKNWDDQEGWRDFFETYWRLIYSVACKAGLNDAEAQDVVQETVLAVAKKMRGFKYDPAIGSFKGWLLLNVRSRIAEHLRRKSSGRGRIEPLGDADSGTSLLERIPDPALNQLEAAWDSEWQRNLLEAALEKVKAKVSARQFLIFDLAALKQVPVGKIKATLSVNAAQIYLAKHRVARVLKEELRKLERQMAAQDLPCATHAALRAIGKTSH